MDIQATLKELDRSYDEIWNLNSFKDFEDLRMAINHYDDLVYELETSSYDNASEVEKEAIDKHIKRADYLKGR